MSVKEKLQTLLNIWFYNHGEDETNFQKWIEEYITYNDGFLKTPGDDNYPFLLDGTDSVKKQYSNSNAYVNQGNGVVSLKGAVFSEGWDNTGGWSLTVDVAYLNGLRYTGLFLLTSVDNPFTGWGIRNWEGGVTGTPSVDSGSASYSKTPDTTLTDLPTGASIYNNPVVGWYTLHMQKTSLTTLKVWKSYDPDNVVTYEWSELSDKSCVTIGAATNGASTSAYGSVFFRNFQLKYTSKIIRLGFANNYGFFRVYYDYDSLTPWANQTIKLVRKTDGAVVATVTSSNAGDFQFHVSSLSGCDIVCNNIKFGGD